MSPARGQKTRPEAEQGDEPERVPRILPQIIVGCIGGPACLPSDMPRPVLHRAPGDDQGRPGLGPGLLDFGALALRDTLDQILHAVEELVKLRAEVLTGRFAGPAGMIAL